MKYLKILGYILLGLLVLLVILGIVLPKTIKTSVSRDMDVPPTVAYHIVNNLQTQEMWNPWKADDETMVFTMGDKTEGVGATYSWTSENSGTGSQTISETVPNNKVVMDVQFGEEDPAMAPFTFEKSGEGTKVTWAFEGHMGFPSNIMGPFMKWGIKSSCKKGLKNIEELANKRWKDGEYFGYTIIEDRLPERNFVLKRGEVPGKGIQQFYVTNLGALFGEVQKSGIEMDGMPCGLFYDYDESNDIHDMAAAIPVAEPIEIENAASVTLDAGVGLVIDHYGDYATLPRTHDAMDAYMRDREMVHHAPIIEEYKTDPTSVDDPSKVLTKVIYYLADTGK